MRREYRGASQNEQQQGEYRFHALQFTPGRSAMPQGVHSTLSTPSQLPVDGRRRDAIYFNYEYQMGFPISPDREAVIELLTAQRSQSAKAKTAES